MSQEACMREDRFDGKGIFAVNRRSICIAVTDRLQHFRVAVFFIAVKLVEDKMKGFFKDLSPKRATILGIAVIAILVVGVGAVYGLGFHRGTPARDTAAKETTAAAVQETTQAAKETARETTEKKETKHTKAAAETKKQSPKASSKTASSKAAKAEKKETKNKKRYCKLTVSCKTAVGNSDLKASKKSVVPANGVIYATKKVTFSDGDTVYDVLRRETKSSGIHMDSAKSPGYNTQYIKGIGNLYEFDCGELSGWMYKVNGSFPNYGCSQYKVKDGDNIQWLYTCDLGEDIGGRNY